MWSHLPLRSLIDLQRKAALEKAGAEIKALYDYGDGPAADRLLDELGERIRLWR